MPIGIGKSTAGLGGYVPQVNLTGATRIVQRRLFFSRRESALLLEKTIRGGFGNLDIGTVMAQLAGDDRLVPFAAITTNTHVSPIGKSFLVADAAGGGADATCQISLSDSYRFQAGDTCILYNTNGAGVWERCTIDAINRTGVTAVVTMTGNITAATFTTANSACLVHRTGAAADDTTALDNATFYILDQDIYTGEGAETIQPDGALTSVVVSNAILYADVIENVNPTVLTRMSMTLDGGTNGRLYILR
jgi:hypothetical protein